MRQICSGRSTRGGGGEGGGGLVGGGGSGCGGGVGSGGVGGFGGGCGQVNAAALTVAVVFLILSASVTAVEAAAVHKTTTGIDRAAETVAAAAAEMIETRAALAGLQKRRIMDCSERCESFEIKIFKAFWMRNHSNKHFIDFLRDMVVYSAYYPELRDFKPVVDNAVQNYEICRYVTCSTDYMG